MFFPPEVCTGSCRICGNLCCLQYLNIEFNFHPCFLCHIICAMAVSSLWLSEGQLLGDKIGESNTAMVFSKDVNITELCSLQVICIRAQIWMPQMYFHFPKPQSVVTIMKKNISVLATWDFIAWYNFVGKTNNKELCVKLPLRYVSVSYKINVGESWFQAN